MYDGGLRKNVLRGGVQEKVCGGGIPEKNMQRVGKKKKKKIGGRGSENNLGMGMQNFPLCPSQVLKWSTPK